MMQMLKPNAIPTVFKRRSVTPKRLCMSSAVEKRESEKRERARFQVRLLHT